MEDFLYSLTSGEWAGQLNAKSVLEAVLTAAAIGLIISLVYLFTHKKEGSSVSVLRRLDIWLNDFTVLPSSFVL